MGIHTSEAIELIHNRPGFAREVARQIGFTHINKRTSEPVLSGLGLTARQRQLLEFIRSYHGQYGIPPSYDEMKEAMDIASKSGIHRIISALEERGHIVRIPYRARCVVLREVG